MDAVNRAAKAVDAIVATHLLDEAHVAPQAFIMYVVEERNRTETIVALIVPAVHQVQLCLQGEIPVAVATAMAVVRQMVGREEMVGTIEV